MDKVKIERINLLAKKSKESGLSEAEKAEQQTLRSEYRDEFRKNMMSQLERTYVIDDNGNKSKFIKDDNHGK